MSFGIMFNPAGEEPAKPVRARTEKGKFQGDDPATPDVNEAWETPAAPKRKAVKKAKE
jgi:hypothetical protein